MEGTGLEKLGYGEWIQEIAAEYLKDDFSLARVIEVNKNSYMVSDGEHEMLAELSGRFMFNAEGVTDFPTVGDWVTIQAFDDSTYAIVHSVLPRKTLLKRKEPGKRIDFQLIAANIDFGLVMQSANHLNLNLLDRYFVMLHESGIQPIAVFSKIDLVSPSELAVLDNTLSRLRNEYLLISNITDEGVEELSKRLIPGETYCLLGKSGVGKTSLLNNLLGTKAFRVDEVREKDGKGRHITTRRQLICIDSGGIIIDTPGMRELGNFEIEDGLDQTFEEFSSYAPKCCFRNCTHTHEDGCAIIEAVKNGEIEKSRYKNYLKIRRESEFYEMSYQEKRTKDKSFGKMIKNYKKNTRKNQID
ncbi:MAG: ribosome small subunit-dependent GTPase A [Deltaproteobacteria bacterium]|nr:ribosome small subunit-dependent GTPase A [Candidatus Zymogenaceae bacterium]